MIRFLIQKIKQKGLLVVIKLGFLRIRHFFRMIFTGSSVKKAFLVCIGKIKPVPYDELVRQREAEIPHPDDLSYRPLISIIIPIYNIEDRFLRPCLR